MWEPIDTAPTDGTRVLIYDQPTVLVARWDKASNAWNVDWQRIYAWDGKPTHWMPIPDVTEEVRSEAVAVLAQRAVI